MSPTCLDAFEAGVTTFSFAETPLAVLLAFIPSLLTNRLHRYIALGYNF